MEWYNIQYCNLINSKCIMILYKVDTHGDFNRFKDVKYKQNCFKQIQ